MLKKILSVLVVSLAIAGPGRAQTVFTSLEDVWKYADAHNTSIRNANYELDKVESGVKQSYMAFLPSVNVNSSFTDNTNLQTTLVPAIILGDKTPGAVIPVQFGQKYIYQAGITAQMDILNLQTWYNMKIAGETKQMSAYALSNVKKTVYQGIASQYYGVLLMKEAARLAAKSRDITDSVYQSVQHKFDEGTANASQLDLAKMNRARAEQTLINAEFQARTAMNSLKGMLDMGVGDSVVISQSLDLNGRTDASASFVDDPGIGNAYHQMRVSLNRYKATNANFAPTLSLGYSALGQQNDNSFRPFDAAGPTWYPANFWQVKLSWPIFTGGVRWLQSKQNKNTYLEQKMNYEAVLKQSAISDDNLRLNYNKSQLLLEKSDEVMKLSFDNYYHISERYEAGIATLDDRLNAYSDYINYQNQYLNTLSDALVQTYLVKVRQMK